MTILRWWVESELFDTMSRFQEYFQSGLMDSMNTFQPFSSRHHITPDRWSVPQAISGLQDPNKSLTDRFNLRCKSVIWRCSISFRWKCKCNGHSLFRLNLIADTAWRTVNILHKHRTWRDVCWIPISVVANSSRLFVFSVFWRPK
jgi:hypothetical protein